MKFQLAGWRRASGAAGRALPLTALAVLLFGGCTPPGPASLLEGRALLERGEARAALLPLHDAVELMRTNGLAWSFLGLAYHQTAQLTNAVSCYAQALRWDRDLVEVRYNLGLACLELGRPAEAKPELTTFTLQRPRSVAGWVARGTAELRTKEPSAALNSFSTALRLSPTNATALNGLGLALVQRGRPREAAPYFTAALQQQPRFASALRNLATVQQVHFKDLPAARQTWQQYAALTPPPADWESVQALLRQLEPPAAPPASTNLPPVAPPPATNGVRSSPPPARPPLPATTSNSITPPRLPSSNAFTVRPAPPTNPPAVRTNPAPPPPPPPTTNPPLELVKLPDTEPLATAREAPTTARETNPPPATTRAPPAAATAPSPAAGSNAEPKRGFFAKINPLNLFKKKPKEPLQPTRLPEKSGSPGYQPVPPPSLLVASNAIPAATTASPALSLTAATPSTSTPPRAGPPPPPRYTYLRPARPNAGNRAEADSAFRAGIAAQQGNQMPSALEAYQRAITADPQFFEAWNNLGLAAHDLSRAEQALAAFENALALRPDSAEARYNFAVALRDAGYPLDAASELQQVLVASPADVRTHLALGNLYAQRLKQPQNARGHYRRVLELDPNNAQAAAIRAWLRNNPG